VLPKYQKPDMTACRAHDSKLYPSPGPRRLFQDFNRSVQQVRPLEQYLAVGAEPYVSIADNDVNTMVSWVIKKSS